MANIDSYCRDRHVSRDGIAGDHVRIPTLAVVAVLSVYSATSLAQDCPDCSGRTGQDFDDCFDSRQACLAQTPVETPGAEAQPDVQTNVDQEKGKSSVEGAKGILKEKIKTPQIPFR